MGSVLALGLLAILFGSKCNYLIFYYYYLLNGKWETEKRPTTNGFNGFDTLFNQFKTLLMSHSTTRVIEYIYHINASICMGFVMQSCVGFLLQFIELKVVNRA